jgi:putative RNA 2'-phosphotransferase
MAPKRTQFKVEKLSKLLVYILGHRPDEFGLAPDREGFITFKEVLWALHEEPGWGYVRQGHINEVLMGKDRALFEASEKAIRVQDPRWRLNLEEPCVALPALLFCPVRKIAHLHVMEKGLRKSDDGFLVLTPEKEIATRIGQRRDRNPVLLEISTQNAHRSGNPFFSFGDLFLTREIPPHIIVGPPISRDEVRPPKEDSRERDDLKAALQAGTFLLRGDEKTSPDRGRGGVKNHGKGTQKKKIRGKKRKGWKEEARKLRKGERKP